MVVYQSANLDVLRGRDGKIVNLNDIARKEINGTKRINQVRISGRRAYLAASFGIVVLDLDKLEIRDSYTNIGPGGSVVQVYATAVANGTLLRRHLQRPDARQPGRQPARLPQLGPPTCPPWPVTPTARWPCRTAGWWPAATATGCMPTRPAAAGSRWPARR